MIRDIQHPIRSTLCAALICGASTLTLWAQAPAGAPPAAAGQPPGGPRGPHHGPPPSLLFNALDSNHDGVISADEINNATASLKTLLKNGQTELTREDLRPPRPAGAPPVPPEPAASPASTDPAVSATPAVAPKNGGPGGHGHHGPPNPLFEALDTNHDGVISASEMENAPASLRTLLKNGQTQLTREDLRPAHGPQQRPPDAE